MAEGEAQAGYIAELVVQVYNIHEVVIEESGGLEGLRDGAMLHAAVARPFATFAGEDLYPDKKLSELYSSPKIVA